MDRLREAAERSAALAQRALGQVDDLIKIGRKAVEVCARLRDENRRLREALRDLTAAASKLQTVTEADQKAIALPETRARALLAELGED